jgi:hypothetical protein
MPAGRRIPSTHSSCDEIAKITNRRSWWCLFLPEWDGSASRERDEDGMRVLHTESGNPAIRTYITREFISEEQSDHTSYQPGNDRYMHLYTRTILLGICLRWRNPRRTIWPWAPPRTSSSRWRRRRRGRGCWRRRSGGRRGCAAPAARGTAKHLREIDVILLKLVRINNSTATATTLGSMVVLVHSSRLVVRGKHVNEAKRHGSINCFNRLCMFSVRMYEHIECFCSNCHSIASVFLGFNLAAVTNFLYYYEWWILVLDLL